MDCANPNDGSLLLQYTLNLLDEEDRYRFEVHMMSCEFCRLELSKGDPETAFIGARKEHIVEALHEEGISFEGLKEELAHLYEIFSTKDALTGLTNVGKKDISFEGK